MEIVIQILFGLMVIGFGVLLWKSAGRWNWVTLVIAPIVFIETAVFIGLVAMSVKARIAWQEVSDTLDTRLAVATEEQETLKYGVPGLESELNAVVPAEIELQRLLIGAGRIWRGLTPQGRNGDQFVLQVPQQAAPAPAAPEAAADGADADAAAAAPAAAPTPPPADPGIPPQTIVYGFSETLNENGHAVPEIYLGQFLVTASNPQSITIQPTIPLGSLTAPQQQGIGRAASWTLYELMPVDGHEPFLNENTRPLPGAIFGEVDVEFINRALGPNVPTETLQRYLKDGKQAQPDDPPEARWWKIEFTQAHPITVDSKDQRSAVDSGYFDTLGQAVDARLQVEEGDEVTFKAGTEIVLKREEAQLLVESGVAKLIDEIYVRPLNDYAEIGRHVYERTESLKEKLDILTREIAIMEKAKQSNDNLLVIGQEEKIKLEAELKQYRIERTAIKEHADKLLARKKNMQTRMASLYRDNIRMVRELEQAQLLLKNRIDQRSTTAGL